MLICPPLYANTVFISVISSNTYSSYDLTVSEYSDALVPALNSYIPRDDNILIGDGVRDLMRQFYSAAHSDIFHIYPFLNLSCQLHIEAVGLTGLFLDFHGISYTVTSNYTGRSYCDISLCNYNSSEIVNSLNFTIVNQNDYSVFVTSLNKTVMTPLSSLYLHDSLNLLNSDAYIHYPTQLPCGVSHVWSSVSKSPFDPPQQFMFNSSVPFSEIHWNVPNKTAEGEEKRVVYTYLLLDDGYSGSAEEVMARFGFSMGPSVVDVHGHRLTDGGMIYSSVKTNLSCSHDQIVELLSVVKETLKDIVDLEVANVLDLYNYLLQLGIVQANQTWIACAQELEYLSQEGAYNGADMCSDWNCTLFFIERYHFNLIEINNNSCGEPFNNILESNMETSWYKGCKQSVYNVGTGKSGRPCITDEDCLFSWGNTSQITYLSLDTLCPFNLENVETSQCDTVLGICTDSHQTAETLFWWCFVNNMTVDFQLTLSLSSAVDPCNISQLRDHFSTNDCVSQSGTGMEALQYRNHYAYVSQLPTPKVTILNFLDDPVQDHCSCYHAIGNEYDLCEDLLCNKPPPCEFTSYDNAPANLLTPSEKSQNDVCSYSYVYLSNQSVLCLNDKRCNWNMFLTPSSYRMTDCVLVGEDDHFCGLQFRMGDDFFYEIVNIPEGKCKSFASAVCVSPLGSVILDTELQDECEEVGYCTGKCSNALQEEVCLPQDPQQPSICYSKSTDMNSCAYLSGEWVEEFGWEAVNICVFPLQNNLAECERNGNIFVDCSMLESHECAINPYVACYLSHTTRLCSSSNDCEQNGLSYCTDKEYFINYLTDPPTNGSCVLPFLNNSDGSWQYCYQNTIPISIGYGILPPFFTESSIVFSC